MIAIEKDDLLNYVPDSHYNSIVSNSTDAELIAWAARQGILAELINSYDLITEIEELEEEGELNYDLSRAMKKWTRTDKDRVLTNRIIKSRIILV